MTVAACLRLPGGGQAGDDGSGGSNGSGGSSGSGGSLSSDVKVCDDLFEGAEKCEQPDYQFYLKLCENEDSQIVADVLSCVVPRCWTPAAPNTEAPCIQNAIQDASDDDVAAFVYFLESACGSQLDSWPVRTVLVHAVSIKSTARLAALEECVAAVSCNDIVGCLQEPDVSPWWKKPK